MAKESNAAAAARWEEHDREWRDPREVLALEREATRVDPAALAYRVRGDFFGHLEEAKATLLVTREYEHLVVGLSSARGKPQVTYLTLPHPSGLAVDRIRGRVWVAATRNPNQIFELAAAGNPLERLDDSADLGSERPLLPRRSLFLPGCAYLHDLAVISGKLHANAVGHNAVVRISGDGWRRVWWPKSIERRGKPDFRRNYLQLNSIAAGKTVKDSFFSASQERITKHFPGQPDWPVDRKGVVFSGRTREPILRGLTRPHSARLHRGGLWVDNSGYGELVVAHRGSEQPQVVARLQGWTRGLCFIGRWAVVATSRVIPRFAGYAPGLDVTRAECGLHLIDTQTGERKASLIWPQGNQIFSVEWLPRSMSYGLPFSTTGGKPAANKLRSLFYGFTLSNEEHA